MSPLVHFLASIVAGLGVGLHHRRKYAIILILSLVALFPDLDHLLPSAQAGINEFHNFYVFLTLPLVVFLVCYIYEYVKRENTSAYQRISLVFFVMVSGHMFLDAIAGNAMALQYPFSTEKYVLSDLSLSVHPYFSLSSAQTLLLIWGSIILVTNLIETRIYRRHEGFYMHIFSYLDYEGVSRPRLWAIRLRTWMRNIIPKRHASVLERNIGDEEGPDDI